MLSRRGLIEAAIGAGVAWLERWSPICLDGCALPGFRRLAAFCSDLGYPHTIGRACLQALPQMERSSRSLSRTLLEQVASASSGCSSLLALRHSIREVSRADFDRGNVVDVDGWILSLTEARLYALGSLWAENAGKESELVTGALPPAAG
jgi:hypothetical protein